MHAHCGIDLLDFFRGRYTWNKLVRLLGQMPWQSRYQLAVADDDEYQAKILESEDDDDESPPGRSKRPSLQRWSPTEDLKATMIDGFNTLAQVQSGKKKKVKPVPRPESGRERAKRARDSAQVAELFDTFTPGR